MNEIQFIPECNADTALLLALGIHQKHINKADNNSKIAKAMEAQSGHFHKTLIGLTDQDKKNIPVYFDQFIEISSRHGIVYKKRPGSNQYLIFLKPAVEGWLLDAAVSINVSISKFGFSEDVKTLKKITTQEGIRRDKSFRDFIMAIKNARSPGLIYLGDIIANHYNAHQYNI